MYGLQAVLLLQEGMPRQDRLQWAQLHFSRWLHFIFASEKSVIKPEQKKRQGEEAKERSQRKKIPARVPGGAET